MPIPTPIPTPPPSPSVLIVEDEAAIRDGLGALFASQGFDVRTAADGEAALAHLATAGFDLVVLDWMLPGISGIEVLRRLRGDGHVTAVLLLTAKGTEDDVVTGLEAGADDYVVKPFGVRELVARARGLLVRRSAKPMPGTARAWTIGRVRLDVDALEIRHESGLLRLSAREASLLEHLIANAHRVVPRGELLVEVWGYRDGSVRTRTVDVHVQQLRSKLRDVPGGADWIGTARGAGYRFFGRAE